MEVHGSFHVSKFTSMEFSGSLHGNKMEVNWLPRKTKYFRGSSGNFHGSGWKLPPLMVVVEAFTNFHQLKITETSTTTFGGSFHIPL